MNLELSEKVIVDALIFSIYVEMNLNSNNRTNSRFYFLHICGDEPGK